jgi:hypothetical protein
MMKWNTNSFLYEKRWSVGGKIEEIMFICLDEIYEVWAEVNEKYFQKE